MTAPGYSGPDRRRARPSPVLASATVTLFAAIAFSTLCPIGLRPHLASADVERFDAYFALGLVATLAAGRRATGAAVAVVLTALALEYAQYLVPSRDPRLADALVKALGGVCGCLAAQASFPMRRLLARIRAHDTYSPYAPSRPRA